MYLLKKPYTRELPDSHVNQIIRFTWIGGHNNGSTSTPIRRLIRLSATVFVIEGIDLPLRSLPPRCIIYRQPNSPNNYKIPVTVARTVACAFFRFFFSRAVLSFFLSPPHLQVHNSIFNLFGVLFLFFSSQSPPAVFHSTAYHGDGQSRRKREHTVRGLRIANAVRQVAPGQDHRTVARRPTARGQERAEPDQRRTVRQLHMHSRVFVRNDRSHNTSQSAEWV